MTSGQNGQRWRGRRKARTGIAMKRVTVGKGAGGCRMTCTVVGEARGDGRWPMGRSARCTDGRRPGRTP